MVIFMRIRWYNAVSIFLFVFFIELFFRRVDIAPIIAMLVTIAGNIENDAFDKTKKLRSKSTDPERDSRIASVLYFLSLGMSILLPFYKILITALSVYLMTTYNRYKIFKNVFIGVLMALLPVYAYLSSITILISIPIFFVTVNREYIKDKVEKY